MLRTIRVILVTLFVLTALGFATLVVYQFTHDDTAPPVMLLVSVMGVGLS